MKRRYAYKQVDVEVDITDEVREAVRESAMLPPTAPGVEWTIIRARRAKSVRDLVHWLVAQIGDDVLRREAMARLTAIEAEARAAVSA